MIAPPKYPSNVLTVVIRDDSPMVFCNDAPSYRSVRITLTDEQLRGLALRCTGQSGPTFYYEAISKCFIEELDREYGGRLNDRGRALPDKWSAQEGWNAALSSPPSDETAREKAHAVYAVMFNDYEGSFLQSVWSTPELAEAERQRLELERAQHSHDTATGYSVDEYAVDRAAEEGKNG